jgi:outer membrane receptor for ferrienterochelin and colicin
MAKRIAAGIIALVSLSTLAQAEDRPLFAPPNLQQPAALPSPEVPNAKDKKDGDGDKPKDDLDKLMSMDLDQLGKVDVVQESTPAALTEVPSDRNIVPAAVTHISKEDIWRCGARNLDELLDIYVPNLEVVDHHWEQRHLGMRGIISDREDKYLLLVNDRIMNDKTHYGAASERELPELDDIDHIDVVRGPGSNIYGPGAVSMVIAIYTDTSETFTGTKAEARGGAVESFTSLELKHGMKWKDHEGGIFLYGGVGSVDGADGFDGPLVLGTSDPGPPGFGDPPQYQGYRAGDAVSNSNFRQGDAFDNMLPLKFFADVIYDDWEVWARYTRSSVSYPIAVAGGLNFNAGQAPPGYRGLGGFGSFVTQEQSGTMNQQATVQSKYESDITEDTKLLFMTGFDHSEFARNLFSGIAEAYGEEELNSRMILTHQLGENQLAWGGEFYNDWFGLPTHLVDAPPTIGRLGGTGFRPWTTQTYSILFEDQWEISEEWTMFLGGRWDKNTYTPWMYSPRAALVYTPSKFTAWKFMANRSQRMNFAEELRANWLNNGTLSDPEILRSYELRLERNPSDNLFWAISAFYIDLDAISWNGAANGTTLTGNQTQWGLEGELSWHNDCWNFVGSHCYTKLLNFTLIDPNVTTFITAAPNGFGNNLSAWSNHISKFIVQRRLTSCWTVDSSLRYYWGYPGSEDIVKRTNSDPNNFAVSIPGWKRPFLESVFLDAGLDYRLNKNTRFRVDGYNLLGIFEPDLNHRVMYGDNSMLSEAPAVGVSGQVTY